MLRRSRLHCGCGCGEPTLLDGNLMDDRRDGSGGITPGEALPGDTALAATLPPRGDINPEGSCVEPGRVTKGGTKEGDGLPSGFRIDPERPLGLIIRPPLMVEPKSMAGEGTKEGEGLASGLRIDPETPLGLIIGPPLTSRGLCGEPQRPRSLGLGMGRSNFKPEVDGKSSIFGKSTGGGEDDIGGGRP